MKTLNEVRIIKEASLENGAIIAANTDSPLYPTEATSYRYVWISDASFVCVAADILQKRKRGIFDLQERFFDWCLNKPEGFDETNLFYQKYHTNGRKADFQYQPHHAGLLMWAIYHHYQGKSNEHNALVERIGRGLQSIWDNDHFDIETYDIWEERRTYPGLGDNHVLSLASSISAFRRADKMLGGHNFRNIANKMEDVLRKMELRRSTFDNVLDMSLLGLVYPFEVIKPRALLPLANQFHWELETYRGMFHRYTGDTYDGWLHEGKSRFKGAGTWPLLNFWIAIYFAKYGNMNRAKFYFNKIVDQIKTPYIPEQLGVVELPLNWATAMYVIAREELGVGLE